MSQEEIMRDGYQPNVNCIHFYRGRCAHPSAKRLILPNKLRVLTGSSDDRCSGCRYQVKHERPSPPSNPPRPPGGE